MASIKFGVWIEVELGEWAREFREASPSQRAVMLALAMEAFNNGEPGIMLSFSEPEVNE